ncbi:MAG: DUF2610 domain-containing protein, partial [Alphaproteobacteria bacterium]|nr:DUF2610 domain-containing protein [Alphaproteobacteria bacterium]
MQHFMIPCDFGGRKAPFPIYVGEPKADSHPLHHQSWWLSSERGGSIPQEVMDSFEKLHTIAKENNVSFEELCVYAMGEALNEEGDQATVDPAEQQFEETPQHYDEQQHAAAPAQQKGYSDQQHYTDAPQHFEQPQPLEQPRPAEQPQQPAPQPLDTPQQFTDAPQHFKQPQPPVQQP